MRIEKKDLRVLLISPIPPPVGGIASWTQQYMKWFNRENLNVSVIDISVIGKRVENINEKFRIISEIQRTIRVIKNLIYQLVKYDPQVAHLNTSCSRFGIIRDFLCAKVIKMKRKKLIIHYRCNIEDQVSSNLITNYFLAKIAILADQNIVLNRDSKEYLLQKTRRDSVLFANFIDREFLLKEDKYINNQIQTILFVGHVKKSKGIIELIHAAHKYPNITFRVAGPVANEVVMYDIPSNVLLLGAVSKLEVREYLKKADVFLFPSHTEGFSNALLEAMSMGVPIIATNVGANKDMIGESGGIIVTVNNVPEIINAIEKINNRDRRSEMSKWNLKKVSETYTVDNIMEELLSLYLFEVNK